MDKTQEQEQKKNVYLVFLRQFDQGTGEDKHWDETLVIAHNVRASSGALEFMDDKNALTKAICASRWKEISLVGTEDEYDALHNTMEEKKQRRKAENNSSTQASFYI